MYINRNIGILNICDDCDGMTIRIKKEFVCFNFEYEIKIKMNINVAHSYSILHRI